MMQSDDDRYANIPMMITAYEDIYNKGMDTVLAVRIWHLVFDKSHSTSGLARKLMNENADESDHSGAAHCPNTLRRTSVVTAAKASRTLVGNSLESAQLELAAGMCYRHITNEAVYKNLLPHYAGQSDKSPGRPAVDLMHLPRGVLNKRMTADSADLGCKHPLAIEWVFNAKRPEALVAGLVHLDGRLMDVNPEQMDVTSYFDMTAPAADEDAHRFHSFRVPARIGSAENDGKGCFFFQTDPFQQNVFDMVLPHSIASSVKPGPKLLALYKERFKGNEHLSVDSPLLLNKFNNTMTGRDQWMQSQINAMTDSIVAFDTFECSPEQRMEAKAAKKAASRGISHYGQMDGESHVIEPRQVLKEHAYQTSNVHSKLIAPWAAEQRAAFLEEEDELRDANDHEHFETSIQHPHFAKLLEKKAAFEKEHKQCMEELVKLHLAKMQRSFTSKIDKESIPAGYRAVWDGLHQELEQTNGTANLAFKEDMQLMDSDRTVFGFMTNWLGTFFEDGALRANGPFALG